MRARARSLSGVLIVAAIAALALTATAGSRLVAPAAAENVGPASAARGTLDNAAGSAEASAAAGDAAAGDDLAGKQSSRAMLSRWSPAAADAAQINLAELLALTPDEAPTVAKGTNGFTGFQPGTSGLACGGPARSCTASGTVSGSITPATLTPVSGFTFTLSTTVPTVSLAPIVPTGILGNLFPPGIIPSTLPPNVLAGLIPVAVFSTTAGLQSTACTGPTGASGTSYTCAGRVPQADAVPLQASTAALCFTEITPCVLGTVSGPGPVAPLPRLVPPPAAVAPPPPIILPPVPAPLVVPVLAPPPAAPPAPSAPEVPVIPEADSQLLLLGGLAALGALAAARRLRRRRENRS
jgi:hypothetical protein